MGQVSLARAATAIAVTSAIAFGIAAAPVVAGLPPCPGDTNGDLVVNIDDIVNVVLDWGTDGSAHGGDVNASGLVDVDDIVAVVLAFGSCRPSNDACDDATMLPLDLPIRTITGTFDGASIDAGLPNCLNGVATGPGVWFRILGEGRLVTARLTGAPGVDTILGVYCPELDCGNLSCILGSTNYGSGPVESGASCRTWCAEEGSPYLLHVAATQPGETGGWQLELVHDVACVLPAVCASEPPPNDDCANAEPLVFVGDTASVTTGVILATVDPEAVPCGPPVANFGGAGIWYSLVGTGDEITAGLCGSPLLFTNTVQVFCPMDGCADLDCVGGNWTGCPIDDFAQFTWCSELGRPYLIRVGRFSGVQSFDLTVTLRQPCAPATPCTDAGRGGESPPNDACAAAIPIVDGLTRYSNEFASTDGAPLPACTDDGDGGTTAEDIWYLYTATTTGPIVITTCEELGGAASHDSDLVLYDGASWPLLCTSGASQAEALIACNDDDPVNSCGTVQGGFHSTLVAPVEAGELYVLRVGSWNTGNAGSGTLLIAPTILGDTCPLALPIAPGDVVALDTCAATPDAGVSDTCGLPVPDGPGVWLETVGDGTTYTVDVCADPVDAFATRVRVYCYDCDFATCVADGPFPSSPGCADGASVAWCTFPGARYRMLVHGTGDPECGTIEVAITSDGAGCAVAPCFPEDCIGDLSQPALPPLAGGATFGLFSSVFTESRSFERIAWPGGDVTALRWWGLTVIYFVVAGPGFGECDNTEQFYEIAFYPDVGGTPDLDNPACVRTDVVPTWIDTGDKYGPTQQWDGERFDATLSPPCSLPPGDYWVSIVDTEDVACWFIWLGSMVGDGSSLRTDSDPVECVREFVHDFDLSICINPASP